MKKTGQLTGRIVGGAVALAVVLAAAAAGAENIPQVVQVIQVKGSARYSSDNKTWHKVNQGDVLEPGVVIQTATHSTVDIQLTDRAVANASLLAVSETGSATPYAPPANNAAYNPEEPKANIVRIYESSVLAIDKLTVERTSADEVADTQLDLRAGQIVGNVKKLSAASKYEIKIPNGVAGIRGSFYHLWASGELHMFSGSAVLAVVGSDGTVKTFLILAGHGFNPVDGTIFVLPPGPPPPLTIPGNLGKAGFNQPPYCPPPISPVR